MLYRKYRPQTWEDLDSGHIRTTLGKAVLNNDWSHAYLLIGTRGIGKTTAARLIAKTVNCTKRKKGDEPCNKCDSCIAITNGSSMDVFEIDAASNTGVDDIRDLREKVKFAPASSKFKVYIIDEVHMLSNSAFNALLKTLEEPPAHVIFVLCTTDPQKLPETVVSRCLVYDFGRATKEELGRNLARVIKAEEYKVKEEVIELVISQARGSHRDAVKLLEQIVTGNEKPDEVNSVKISAGKLVEALFENRKKEALTELEKYCQGSGKIKDLISEMLVVLRDLLLEGKDVSRLVKKLIEANALLINCPVQSLVVEMIIMESCGDAPVIATPSETREKQSSDGNDIIAKWPEIVVATKPFNHSLNAFLKAAAPTGMDGQFLKIKVAYKFHKEKLEEPKNRDILEKVISDIMGQNIKVKFELGGEKHGNV